MMNERLLVLVRHGQSDWNLKNLFTGWKDPDLTELGVSEARTAGRRLKEQGFTFDVAFTSALTRAQKTLDLALAELGQSPPITRNQALNERMVQRMKGILEEIRKLVEEQAKKDNYDYVFDKSGLSTSQVPFLLYTKDATDITDVLLKTLNDGVPAPEEKKEEGK